VPVLLHQKVSNHDAAGHVAIIAGPATRFSPMGRLHVQDYTVQLLQEFSLPFRTAHQEPQNYELFGGSRDPMKDCASRMASVTTKPHSQAKHTPPSAYGSA
jgi:hypothetical protein